MAQNEDYADGYDVGPTPDDVAASQQNTYNQELQHGGSVQRNMANITRGVQIFNGGGPAMHQAQNVQQRLQSILADVNSQGSDDEDPLVKQMRLSKALSTGMVDVNPKLAMQANDKAQQISQAMQQQKLLSLKTQEAQQTVDQNAFNNKVKQITGQIVFTKKGEDGNMEAYGTVDPTDPDYQSKVAQIQAQAQKDGVAITPMTSDSFVNGKNAVAQVQAQARLQASENSARAREYAADQQYQAALARAAQAQANGTGKGMTGNQAMMSKRIMSATVMGSGAMQAIAELPFGATDGDFFGRGKSPGESMLTSSVDSLRNKFTSQDNARYNEISSQLERNLAMVESQGGLQGGQQMSGQIANTLKIRPGDRPIDVFTKMADARRIFDDGSKIQLADPSVPPEIKQVLQQSLDDLHKSVPFNLHDIQQWERATQKNPKLTFTQYSQQHGLGQQATSQGDGSAPDGKVSMDDGTGKIFHIPANMTDQFRQEHPNAKPLTAP